MQTSFDLISTLGTELGRLVVLIFIGFASIKAIREDVKALSKEMNEKDKKIAWLESERKHLKEDIKELKEETNLQRDKIYKLEAKIS